MRITAKTLFAALLLCGGTGIQAQKYVGGDISLLPTYEAHGVHYLDRAGNQTQPLEYFRDSAGWNAQRVRLFVDPSKASSADRAIGAVQDLDYVTRLSRRIKADGYALMLDLHYSDTWTDPGKHSTPSSWTSSDPEVLADSVYAYTKRVLLHLKANDATPDFVQPGNEVTYGMLWPTGHCLPNGNGYNGGTFANFLSYLQAGVRAIREVCPEAKVVLQTEMSNPTGVTSFYNTIGSRLDYDIIGLSYYPDFHGPLSVLTNAVTTLERQHSDKEIMVVETGYEDRWQLEGSSYTSSQTGWPVSEEGQRKFAADLVDMLNAHKSVTGLFWWAPEDNEYWASSNPARSSWWNASLYVQDKGRPLAAMFELMKFIGKDPTGITSIQKGKADGTGIYDLEGRQVNTPQKNTIYIKGNRKVIYNEE